MSWKRLLCALFGFFYFLNSLAAVSFRNEMYSPLNQGGTTKQKMHDDMLSQAQSFLNATVLGNQNYSLPSLGRKQDSAEPLSRSLIIITAQRKQPYLDVLLWSLLVFNDPQYFESTAVTLLNTERPPEGNYDLQRWTALLPDLTVRNIDTITNATASGRKQSPSWVRRGVSDYVIALEQCQKDETSWCIIVEEDTLLSRNFFTQFVQTVEIPLTAKRIQHQHIGMVKLFVSDHWDGFSSSWVHVKDVAYIMLAAVVFGTLLLWILPSSPSTTTLPSTTPSATTSDSAVACQKWLVTCIFSFAGTYILCRLVGRQYLVNLFEPNKVHLDSIQATAGTVAIAYPQSSIPHVLEYLKQQLASISLQPIDVALNGWLESTTFSALRTRPSLVQHLGAYSSASYKNQGDFKEMKQDSSFVFR